MEKGERSVALKKNYQTRLTAFKEVRRIELARDRFHSEMKLKSVSLEQLISAGYLTPAPSDPYGGVFYLEPDGKVSTTSKFAYEGAKKAHSNHAGEGR